MTNCGVEWMARKRRYNPLVASDLKAAVNYYDNISVDLGNGFRTSIRKRLNDITRRPKSFGRIHGQIRATLVERFPYVILF